MAKKKKPTARTAATRRTTRRGKAQQEGDGTLAETSAPANENPPTAETESDPKPKPASANAEPPTDASHDVNLVEQPPTDQSKPLNPVVALHKKFGKYRCLFNSEEGTSKKYETGSDSETNSSIEIRVVDPCASSESDSNAAIDNQSDTVSGTSTCSPMNSTISTIKSNSRNASRSPSLSDGHQVEIENTEVINKFSGKMELVEIPIPLPEEPKPVERLTNIPQEALPVVDTLESTNNEPIKSSHADEMTESEIVYEEDEVITVVQIVEDDNPEYYYNIQITSPKDVASNYQESDTADVKESTNDFQKHFESLNLSSSCEINLPMEVCGQNDNNRPMCPALDLSFTKDPDVSFSKDQVPGAIQRPDPSLTPSSILSDDSNSSRVTELTYTNSNDSSESSPTGVRRSSRLKTISNLKQKTKGYGLVKTPLKKALMSQIKLKLEDIGSDSQERLPEQLMANSSNSPTFPVPTDMPVKVKSRWRRSSELELATGSPVISPLASPSLPQKLPSISETQSFEEGEKKEPLSKESCQKIIEERMNQFMHLEENDYLCERMISKDTKKMICDCFLTKEELERGELGCGEDCLNRLLMIECNSRCPVGDRCTNRRFQKKEIGPLKVFYADKKGCGVEASEEISSGEFLMEYVGEVLDYDQFYKRAQAYSDDNNLHHYFMSLKGDTVIDATMKGNISRFINHSCDPNAETQKWTVNGELRIGFFSKRDIPVGQEITFDYQFQRFGKVAQRCYCGADNCRGWIGAEPDSDDEDYEEQEPDVSTSKSSREQTRDAVKDRREPRRNKRRERPASDLEQDADIEDDIDSLTRTGIKNQSHTLLLSRTMVRAKGRRAQASLLKLLRGADLPCRRLFLDYRGLRLLAPWCTDAPLDFKLEMLQTVDRLPIPNKTIIQESRFFNIVERWLSTTPTPDEQVFIDESTGLPTDVPTRSSQSTDPSADKSSAILEKVKNLSKQLLERWSSLKEVFKIPKKERIQQMKEHERQANVERRAADSSGSRDRDRNRDDRERERERDRDRRDRDRDRDKERDRHRDRDRDRDRDDRDRRKRRSSPEGRRSIRLSDRVLAAVPPLSKEERRRAFAEAAAAADDHRRRADDQHRRETDQRYPNAWGHNTVPPMFGAVVGPGGDAPPDWLPPDYPYCAPYTPQTYYNFMNMPPGFGMGGFMFGQGPFPNMPDGRPDMMMNQGMPPGMMPPHQGPFPTMPDVRPEMMNQGMPSAGLPPGAMPPQHQPQPPPEVVLPSMWRSATDPRGRTYYYHVKLRQPQWAPPPPPADVEEYSEDEEEMAPMDTSMTQRKGKFVEGVNGIYEVIKESPHNGLIPEHALVSVRPRKRRPGLVSERPISPRTEEDKLAGRLEVKRYKETKEKLRRRKEKLLQKVRLLHQATKKKKEITAQDLKMVELVDTDSDSNSSGEETPLPALGDDPPAEELEEATRRIKEVFRSSMARVMVQHLNPYRHRTAAAGRITNTADFKHLARKLTHFVMLKELKHCRAVDELVVTDSVRSKAKEFVKKYMAKFGPVYKRPIEEID